MVDWCRLAAEEKGESFDSPFFFIYIPTSNKYFYIQVVSKILIDLLTSTKLSIFAALSGDNLSHYV